MDKNLSSKNTTPNDSGANDIFINLALKTNQVTDPRLVSRDTNCLLDKNKSTIFH